MHAEAAVDVLDRLPTAYRAAWRLFENVGPRSADLSLEHRDGGDADPRRRRDPALRRCLLGAAGHLAEASWHLGPLSPEALRWKGGSVTGGPTPVVCRACEGRGAHEVEARLVARQRVVLRVHDRCRRCSGSGEVQRWRAPSGGMDVLPLEPSIVVVGVRAVERQLAEVTEISNGAPGRRFEAATAALQASRSALEEAGVWRSLAQARCREPECGRPLAPGRRGTCDRCRQRRSRARRRSA